MREREPEETAQRMEEFRKQNTFRKVPLSEVFKIHVELPPPTGAEIDEILERVQDRLEDPDMLLAANHQVKKGYEIMVEILAEEINEHANLPASLLERMNGEFDTQSRAMAQCAIDYLNGNQTREFIINIPIKPSIKKDNGKPTDQLPK